jgi:hypothetical protein
MQPLSIEKPPAAPATGPDPAWHDLYRVGGVAALLATLAYIVGFVAVFAVPAAPTSGGAATLEYIAAHRSIYIVEQALWQAPSVLLTVVFLALYPALKDLNRSYAAIGAVLGIISWAVTLAYPATGGGAPAWSPERSVHGRLTGRNALSRLPLKGSSRRMLFRPSWGLGGRRHLIVALVMAKGVFRRASPPGHRDRRDRHRL